MNTDDLIFRKATPEDVEQLAKYRVQFLNEVGNTPDHPQSKQLEQELIAYFDKAIRQKTIVNWLAIADEQIVATSAMSIWETPLGYGGLGKEGRRGYVLNMFTIKAYRRKGISGLLLEKLLEEAQVLNLESVNLHATNDGQSLYRKHGFKEPHFPELKLIL